MDKNKSNKLRGLFLAIGLFTSLFAGLTLISESADAIEGETSTHWYLTGNGIYDVALEDINKDGYLDVVTANYYESKFYTLTNDGNGYFENKVTYSVNISQYSLIMGDVDGDNDLDIVNTNPGWDSITVMYNLDGLGSFGSETSYSVGHGPLYFYLGDIDNDKDLDVVTANNGFDEYNISVLKNDGKGQFGSHQKYWIGSHPLGIHRGDLNGDKYIDVVTTHKYEGSITVLFNNGKGGFEGLTSYSVGEYPNSVFIGDVDGDSDQDIVVTNGDDALNRDEDSISVLKNDGHGHFSSRTDYQGGNNPHSLHLSDIDGDGDLDAITVNSDYNLGVFLNDGDGAFKTKLEFPSGGFPISLCVGDIDLDNDLDVVVASDAFGTADRIYVLTNRGNGWFNSEATYPTPDGTISVFLGDIDGDDDLDIVSANYYGKSISVYFNDGDANFGERTDYTVLNWNYPNTVALGDMDNDGDLDLFYSGGGAAPTGYVSLRKNNGAGVFGSQLDYAMGQYPILYLAEINGDNYLDMVCANKLDNDLSLRLNDGAGGFLGESTFGGTNGLNSPGAICMGNIDWDNDVDLVLADGSDDEAVVFKNNGAGTFTWSANYPVGGLPMGIILGDVDKDNDLDLITANRNGDTFSVLENVGGGNYGTKTDYPVGDQPFSVAVGDVDGDSDNDIIAANYQDGTLTLYKNNGYGGFGFREDYPTGTGADSVTFADIDKDVDLDIILANSGPNTISIRFNRKNIDFYLDTDEDGFPDFVDAFPDNSLEWTDSDGDGWGDNSDELPWDPFEHVDSDGDRHGDQFDDAFPQDPTEWDDSDGDGWGDNSDAFPLDNTEWLDSDNDGVGNNADFMPYDASQQHDSDGDGYGDNINGNKPDLFPDNPVEWEDNDGDDIGNNADDDDDNDGYSDNLEQSYGTDTYDPNDHPFDFDGDYIPDDKDEDDDNDGFSDTIEQNLGYNSKDADEYPPDNDEDGIPDAVDEDDDNDGWTDKNDAFPYNPAGWKDTDSDGNPDEIDENVENPTNLVEDDDDDNDGHNDAIDDFPTNPNEWRDTDSDGTGDNSDSDIDNDGWSNYVEDAAGSNPMDKDDTPTDTDSDGIADNADLDDDNDGVPDYEDFAPLDATVQTDPNLIRIAGIEFEIGELVVGLMMAAGAVFLGTIVFTRKKRLYNKYKNRIDNTSSVAELNEINKEIKTDMEKERLTSIQLTILKDQFDDKYMNLRESELDEKLGKLPSKVEERIREVISDKIITEDEFEGIQKWLVRLRESKDFNSDKKEKLQEVLKDWINENIE